MIPEELKRAREICDAATPGPWKHENMDDWGQPVYNWVSPIMKAPEDYNTKAFSDMRFIAAARTLLPKALDALEQCCRESNDAYERIFQLEKERDQWKAACLGRKEEHDVHLEEKLILKDKITIAVEALEFYTHPNVALNLKTKEVMELRQIVPGVVWDCHVPTSETIPVTYGTVAKNALEMIK